MLLKCQKCGIESPDVRRTRIIPLSGYAAHVKFPDIMHLCTPCTNVLDKVFTDALEEAKRKVLETLIYGSTDL